MVSARGEFASCIHSTCAASVVVSGYRLTRRPVTVVKFHTCYTSMLCKACYSSGVGWANNVPLHLQKWRCYGQEGGWGGWGRIITSLALRSHALPHIRHATVRSQAPSHIRHATPRWPDLLLRSTCSWYAWAYVAWCVLIRSCYASTCLGSYASIWFDICCYASTCSWHAWAYVAWCVLKRSCYASTMSWQLR